MMRGDHAIKAGSGPCWVKSCHKNLLPKIRILISPENVANIDP